MKRKTVLAIVASLFAFAGVVAHFLPASAQARKHFSFDDFARVVRVNDPQISPDGKRIVASVSRTDLKGDTDVSELILIDVATGDKRSLTPDRKDAGSPQWSPDGKWLAFVSSKQSDKDAKPQIYVLPMDGGEGRAVTNASNGVGSYAWRPDGKAFAYTMTDEAKNKDAVAKHHDLFTVGDQDYLSQAPPVPTRVWVQTIDSGKPKVLTPTNWSVDGGVSWSGDGKYVAFSHLPDLYRGHDGHIHAAIVEVATGKITDLTQGNIYSTQPVFAPNSDQLLYVVGRENLWAYQNRLMLTSLANLNERTPIADNVDRNISGLWTPQHDIFISAQDRVRTHVWKVQAGASNAVQVDTGDEDFGISSVANDGTIAATESDASHPGDVVVLHADGTSPRRLTDYNPWLAAYDLARRTEFTWTNDGFSEDGVLTYPVNYTAGTKYPVILNIHGGPTGGGSAASFDEFSETLAARGYFVFEPNYRASGNLGFAYAKAWLADPVAGAGRDVVAGVNALKATGMIDPHRIGVSGWSAGGWMTSWLITHYHIWAAAVSGAAVNDAIEEYSLNDIYDYLPALLKGATPWTPGGMAIYVAASPITFVRNVTTPTLILSDTGDYRVPTVQAYELYHALKDLGKPVKFVAIPVSGHFPSDAIRTIDTYKVWLAWMDRYLK